MALNIGTGTRKTGSKKFSTQLCGNGFDHILARSLVSWFGVFYPHIVNVLARWLLLHSRTPFLTLLLPQSTLSPPHLPGLKTGTGNVPQ